MKKKILFGILAIIAICLLAVPDALAAYYNYDIDIYRDKGFRTSSGGFGDAVTSGVQYIVFDAGTQDIATLYSDAGTTSKTNLVSATTFGTDSGIDFYCDATSVDIYVVDQTGGYSLFLDGVTTSTAYASINEVPGIMHHGMIWYTVSCSATYPRDLDGGTGDTGIDIAAGTFIHGLCVEVLSETVSSDIFMAVGLGATNQGLIQAAVTDRLTGATLGGQFMYYSDQSEYFVGSLMDATYSSDAESGTAVVPKGKYMVLTDASLTYSFESADEVTSDTFDSAGYGFIHYFFTPARVW